jgi:hypothetical protein
MVYRLLADFILLFHFVFIVFVLFGGLLACKWRRLAWVHLPSMVWGALNELFGLWCPLTPLENWLRENGGAARYQTGFIEHYVMPVVYPAGLTREIQIVMGSAVVVMNGLIYGILLRRATRVGEGRADG